MTTDTSGSDLTHIFASVQSLLLAVGSLEAFLTDVAKLAAGVTSQTSCGITMQREGEPTTVASSDDRALGLDETQYAVGHGPCLHTLHTGETTALDDVQTDTRWPEYMAAARQRGLRSSLSLPLRLNGGNFGVMNLYSFDAQNSFTDSRRRRLETFAAQASGAVQLAAQQVRDSQVRSHLEQALDSRAVIDQALGIIMGQQRCTSTQAFALLRQQSQSSHQRLRDVAADLILGATGEPPQQGKPFQT